MIDFVLLAVKGREARDFDHRKEIKAMSTITIYGHSDDCIEIEGDIREEFASWEEWKYLHFDDGTIVEIGYALVQEKGWAISIVKQGTASARTMEPKLDDGEHYTDRLELTGEIHSVECWGSAEGATEEDLDKFWEDFDSNEYPSERLLRAYRVLKGR